MPYKKLKFIEFQNVSSCPLKCIHCLNDNTLKTSKVLSKELFQKVIDEIKPISISITGGEPTTNLKSVKWMIQYCKKNGVKTQLNTNGVLLNEKKINDLVKLGLNVFHVTYNDLDEAHMIKYRGAMEGDFKRLEDNLKYMINSGAKVYAETTILPWTKDILLNIHNRLSDLGVTMHELQSSIPSGRQSWKNTLNPKELSETLYKVLSNRRKNIVIRINCCYASKCSPYNKHFKFEGEKGIIFRTCLEGVERLHVHNNGDVLICDTSGLKPIGNLYKEDLKDIYDKNSVLNLWRKSKFKDCIGCKYYIKCKNMCQGQVFDFNKGITGLSWKKFRKETSLQSYYFIRKLYKKFD